MAIYGAIGVVAAKFIGIHSHWACIVLTVASFLARESKGGLLLGESAGEEVLKQVDILLKENQYVQNWNLPQTMHFGPSNILMVLEIDLIEGLEYEKTENVIAELRENIHRKQPQIDQIFIHVTELGTSGI